MVESGALRGSIGIAGIVFLVVAAAAPLTTIGGVLPVMLAISNGPGVPLAYVVVAVVLLLFSVGYSRHGSPHVGSLAQTGSAVVILAVFALAGADPVLALFTWMSGLATISMLVLMILTGVAVIAFFARQRVDTRVWHTRIAPALGLVGLLGVTVLALANFTTLISGSTTLAGILLALVAVFFAGGLLLARLTRPLHSTPGRTPS